MGVDHQVFRAMQTVQFEHKCADAEPHQVQAYAELRSENGRARALALLYARRDPVRRREIIGCRCSENRARAGSGELEYGGSDRGWSGGRGCSEDPCVTAGREVCVSLA